MDIVTILFSSFYTHIQHPPPPPPPPHFAYMTNIIHMGACGVDASWYTVKNES